MPVIRHFNLNNPIKVISDTWIVKNGSCKIDYLDPEALGHPRVRLAISPVHVAYLVRVGHEQGKLPGLAIDQVEWVGVGLATWGIKCRPSMKLTHLSIGLEMSI